MPQREGQPLSTMDSQFAFPDRQIHSLPRRVQQTKRRPTPCDTRQSSKEPPCKVRRLDHRQPRYSEKDTFRSYREPTRIPSDTTTTTNDGWGSSDDEASTDRTLTDIEQELGNDRDSSPTVTEQEEGDQVEDDLAGSPCPSSPTLTKGKTTNIKPLVDPGSGDGRGEKRRRRVESFRGQKRRKSEVSSDEETDTSDDEVFREAKVKSPKITTVYVPNALPKPIHPSRALGPSASVAELARRIRCLDAAGSDIIMATDSEGEEDEAMVSAALYSLPEWESEDSPAELPPPYFQPQAIARPCILRLALIKRRELNARKTKTKAPFWARASASDPNRAFWAKYMYATSFARSRARCDEYGDKMPGQQSNRYLRKVAISVQSEVSRPGPPRGWAPNAMCLGQINIYLIRETVAAKLYRRELKLYANALAEVNLPVEISYQIVPQWWKDVEPVVSSQSPEDEEAVEEGLLPPVEVEVDLEAAEAMYTRRPAPSPEVHEIADEVEDVDDQEEVDESALVLPKRARSESAEPRESTEDRNRRINETVALEMEQRAARHAQLETRVQEEERDEVQVIVSPAPRRLLSVQMLAASPILPSRGQVLGGALAESPSSASSVAEDDLESILAPESERSTSSATTSSFDRSDPPNYDDLHPLPIALPIPAAVLVTLPRHAANPPPYQARLPLRGSAYDARRTPSPPPPFNAQTDALTLIPATFVPYFLESDYDEEEVPPYRGGHVEGHEVGRRYPPFPGVQAVADQDRREREREQRIVGSFPRPATPPTPTPRGRPGQARAIQIQTQTTVEVRPRLTESALRQHTRAQVQSSLVDSFDAARDMESADLEAELEEVDEEEEWDASLVSGLRRWVGRFWG